MSIFSRAFPRHAHYAGCSCCGGDGPDIRPDVCPAARAYGQAGGFAEYGRVKLRRAVVPGDQIILTAEAVKSHTRNAHCKCKAMVGDVVVAECELKFMLVDNDKL